MSDKPAWVQALAKGTNNYDTQRKREMQNLLAVDDAVAQVLAALADTGRLEDTLIVFASDNGTVAFPPLGRQDDRVGGSDPHPARDSLRPAHGRRRRVDAHTSRSTSTSRRRSPISRA